MQGSRVSSESVSGESHIRWRFLFSNVNFSCHIFPPPNTQTISFCSREDALEVEPVFKEAQHRIAFAPDLKIYSVEMVKKEGNTQNQTKTQLSSSPQLKSPLLSRLLSKSGRVCLKKKGNVKPVYKCYSQYYICFIMTMIRQCLSNSHVCLVLWCCGTMVHAYKSVCR